MGHHLTSFLGRPAVLQRLAVPRLRLLGLPQGFALAPMPEEIIKEIMGERDMMPDEVLDEMAKPASHAGLVGWLISDWFGGNGSTELVVWGQGLIVATSQAKAFALLGVVRSKGMDEWDSLDLGCWRDTERAYAAATPVVRADTE
jgi:hypothetical protein